MRTRVVIVTLLQQLHSCIETTQLQQQVYEQSERIAMAENNTATSVLRSLLTATETHSEPGAAEQSSSQQSANPPTPAAVSEAGPSQNASSSHGLSTAQRPSTSGGCFYTKSGLA